jgi:hypothetical protein
MKYALLIYAAEKDFAAMSKEEQGRVYSEYMAYTIDLKKSGKMLSSGIWPEGPGRGSDQVS